MPYQNRPATCARSPMQPLQGFAPACRARACSVELLENVGAKVCLAEAEGIERDLTVRVAQARAAVVETPRRLQGPFGIQAPLFNIAAHRRYFESRLIEVRRGARVGDRLPKVV